MNYAIIIAGGSGKRSKQEVPKQFVSVYDKPILIYTLEAFEKHPEIDHIIVVCIEGWESILSAYCKQYNINKILKIVKGGNSGQESIRNGVNSLVDTCKKDDVVIIHDGIRPLVDDYVLSDVIVKTQKHGNGVTSLPYNEQIFEKADDFSTFKYIPRETLRRVQTPQGYRFDLLYEAYQSAFEKEIGIHGSSYTNTMMVDLGHKLFFAAGSDRNLKITNPDDFALFKAMIDSGIYKG